MPTPTRRKNRHDKDRMIYLTKREIEKEFHTPRFEKSGQELWCLVSRGNHRLDNRYDGGSTGKMAQRLWLAAVFQSLPPQRAHWHFAGSAGKCHSGFRCFPKHLRTPSPAEPYPRKESPISKIHRTVVRNERYRKNAISVRERHNERKNEVYSNPDVLLEYSRNNVTFKACEAATYAQQFDRMVEEGVVSTRGLKPDAYVFDELVFDVNTDYFETHGGYEYAKQFYAEVYELAKEIAGGEQYIISAVMHADERNREASDRLGRDVFHYHLHVVYLPVVEKQIRWSKRCKDPALRGTVRETIMQVSHSKKWPMVPMTNEQGQPVLKKNGKPRLVSSYSLLQTEFFEHMRQAGFTDFERGIKGSDAEHLNVLEYKVQKDRQTVAELSDQTKQLQGKRKELISQVKNISGSIRDVTDIEQRAKTKGVLEKRVELPVQDFQTLCKMAKASGKLQAENRSLWMQLQQSTVREQELGQRLRRCEEQLDAVLTETRPYREAVRVAPEQVQAFVLGICRRQQEEKRLNRQQRRQRAKGQDR